MGNVCRNLLLPLALLFLLVAPATAIAESIWFAPPSRGDELRLETVLPNFKNSEHSTFSMAYFLSGTFEPRHNLHISADIPFAHVAEPDGSESSTALGNPYLGVRVERSDSTFAGELGVRLPFASHHEWATGFGYLIDAVDRPEAFYADVASIILGANYQYRSPEGFGVRTRVSPILQIDTEGNVLPDDNYELWIAYSAQGFYQSGPVGFGVGLTGRHWATVGDRRLSEYRSDFGQRSLHEIDLFMNLDYGRLRPSLRIRVPLDEDLTRLFGTSAVLSLGVGLP